MAQRGDLTRREFESRLIVQAWKDEAFAAALRRDPRAAVQAELKKLGLEASLDNVDIKVLEETPTTLYLVIPRKPAEVLSDAELEKVAGGAGGLMQLVAYGAQC